MNLGEAELLKVGEMAVKVMFAANGKSTWVPMACVHDDSEIYGRDVNNKEQPAGSSGSLVCKRWWVRKKGADLEALVGRKL